MNESYSHYLQSKRWQAVRLKAFAFYGRKCNACGAGGHVHAHHLFYPKDLNETKVEHLIPLCEICHKAVHSGVIAATVKQEGQSADKRREILGWLRGVPISASPRRQILRHKKRRPVKFGKRGNHFLIIFGRILALGARPLPNKGC